MENIYGSKRIFSVNYDEHTKFEKQTLRFILCFSWLIISVIMCFYTDYSVTKNRALTTTSAGTQTKFSRSHTTFTLKKMHWSADRHTTYVPFQFESTKNLSIDANDYKVTVLPAYGSIHYRPTGNLVLFGKTGSGVIIITSEKKIPNEVLSIYIENTAELKTSDMDNSQDVADISAVKGDKGFEDYFKKHDILKFTVSPGAKNISKTNRVKANIDQPEKLYTELFGMYDVSNVEKKIKQDKKKIRLYTKTAEKLQNNLERSGYAIIDKPKWLDSNWRPYDYVDPTSGRYSNGQRVGTKINADDPDDIVYSDMPIKNNSSDFEGNKTEVEKSLTGSTVDNSDKQATEWWTSLIASWDSIKEAKRDWMVDQNTKLYEIKYMTLEQAKQMSVGSSSNFRVRGKVNVK